MPRILNTHTHTQNILKLLSTFIPLVVVMALWMCATTKLIKMHILKVCNLFYIKYTGEGSGSPLQYSCLENPMDGGAW